LPVVDATGLWILGGAGLLAGSFGFGGGLVPECALYREYIEYTYKYACTCTVQ